MATYDELSQTSATVGVTVTPQALEKRFTTESAERLKQVLKAGVEQVIFANPQVIPILQRFSAISVQNSTTVTLPQMLATIWPGSGRCVDDIAPAGLKIQLRWDLLTGAFCDLHLQEWRSEKPWRILTEVYAKLLAMVIQHWLMLAGCWHLPQRSRNIAAKTIARTMGQ